MLGLGLNILTLAARRRGGGGGEAAVLPIGVTSADQMWIGSMTAATSVMAASRLTSASSDVRLVASTASDFSTQIIGEPVATQSGTDGLSSTVYHYAKPTVTGLSQGTKYYFGIAVDGILSSQDAARGRAWTKQTGPYSYAWWHASCAGDAQTGSPPTSLTSVSNHAVFEAIKDKLDADEVRSGVHLGDIHYANIETNNESYQHAAMNAVFGEARQAALYKSGRHPRIGDDHDDVPTGTTAVRPALAAMLNKRVPMEFAATPSSTQAAYMSEVIGRQLHIYTAVRTLRTSEGATDNSSKTMLGATQKAWFKTQIDYAAANNLAVEWYGGTPMLTIASDDWSKYLTELRELADYIDAAGLSGLVTYHYGDNHRISLALWEDCKFNTGGTGGHIFQTGSAPLDQEPSPAQSGNYDTEEIVGQRGQFVVSSIVDNGGPSYVKTWTGYRAASSSDKTLTTLFSHSMTFVLDRDAFDFATHGLDDTAAAAGALWTSNITGAKAPGSIITATSSDGTVLTVDMDAMTVSGTFSGAGSPNITITESLPSADDGVDVVGVTVSGATLQTLSLNTPSDAPGLPYMYAVPTVAWYAGVTGRTALSTITATSSDGATITWDSVTNTLSGTFATAGLKTITLTETLGGAGGSPKVTVLTDVVNCETATLYDTFTDTAGIDLIAHTGEVGASWTQHGNNTGVTKISGTDAYSASSSVALTYATPSATDVRVRARLRKRTTVAGDGNGIVFRCYTASDQFYHLRWFESTGMIQVYRRKSGSNTVFVNLPVTFVPGQTIEIEAAIAADTPVAGQATISWSVDGVVQTPIVDTAPNTSAGRVGIRSTGTAVAAGTGVHVDYVAAY